MLAKKIPSTIERYIFLNFLGTDSIKYKVVSKEWYKAINDMLNSTKHQLFYMTGAPISVSIYPIVIFKHGLSLSFFSKKCLATKIDPTSSYPDSIKESRIVDSFKNREDKIGLFINEHEASKHAQ